MLKYGEICIMTYQVSVEEYHDKYRTIDQERYTPIVHPTLKFTCESWPTHVNFLDTYKKVEDNFLHTNLYVKPTDTHMYLHSSSCHPKHSESGGPYSQLLHITHIMLQARRFQ